MSPQTPCCAHLQVKAGCEHVEPPLLLLHLTGLRLPPPPPGALGWFLLLDLTTRPVGLAFLSLGVKYSCQLERKLWHKALSVESVSLCPAAPSSLHNLFALWCCSAETLSIPGCPNVLTRLHQGPGSLNPPEPPHLQASAQLPPGGWAGSRPPFTHYSPAGTGVTVSPCPLADPRGELGQLRALVRWHPEGAPHGGSQLPTRTGDPPAWSLPGAPPPPPPGDKVPVRRESVRCSFPLPPGPKRRHTWRRTCSRSRCRWSPRAAWRSWSPRRKTRGESPASGPAAVQLPDSVLGFCSDPIGWAWPRGQLAPEAGWVMESAFWGREWGPGRGGPHRGSSGASGLRQSRRLCASPGILPQPLGSPAWSP